jgi:ATP-dependent Clp protease adaptor protein ClpS
MASEAPAQQKETRSEPDTEQPRHWHVVLLDDDDHSYEYVIMMMQALFAHPIEKAFEIAKKVDADGRAICLTTHKEHAELKQEQILAFGKDPLIDRCAGSMSAVIEPADYGDDDSGGGEGAGPS